jgi:hypothetical protein
VSKIRFEYRKEGREVPAFLNPASEAMDCEGVSEIMNSGSFARTTVRNPGIPEELTEIGVDGFPIQGASAAGRLQEVALLLRIQMDLARIRPTTVGQLFGHGHLSVLAELTRIDSEHAGMKVDIIHF